jgi:hypothetical protein
LGGKVGSFITTVIVGEVNVEVGGKDGLVIAGVGVGVVAVPLHPVG